MFSFLRQMFKSLEVLAVISTLIRLSLSTCGDLQHGNLTAAVVQVSTWLRENYRDDVTNLEPHVASSMIVALRLAGYQPRTILADFRTSNNESIIQFLKATLDKTTDMKLGHLAAMHQAIASLCYNTLEFYGHNVTNAFLQSLPILNDVHDVSCYEHNFVFLVLCQTTRTTRIQSSLLNVLYHNIRVCTMKAVNCSKSPDTIAMGLMALSCFYNNIHSRERSLRQNLEQIIELYYKNILGNLKKKNEVLWNVQSKALVLQSLVVVPNHLKKKDCGYQKKLLSGILEHYDPLNVFGNVVSNIQVLPALMGRSIVHSDQECYKRNLKYKKPIWKNICVKIVDVKTSLIKQSEWFKVYENTTAYETLKLASQRHRDRTFDFEELHSSYGKMITSISGVKQNPESNYYWALYESDYKMSNDGVDVLVPKNNTCVIFKYEQYSCKTENVHELNQSLNDNSDEIF